MPPLRTQLIALHLVHERIEPRHETGKNSPLKLAYHSGRFRRTVQGAAIIVIVSLTLGFPSLPLFPPSRGGNFGTISSLGDERRNVSDGTMGPFALLCSLKNSFSSLYLHFVQLSPRCSPLVRHPGPTNCSYVFKIWARDFLACRSLALFLVAFPSDLPCFPSPSSSVSSLALTFSSQFTPTPNFIRSCKKLHFVSCCLLHSRFILGHCHACSFFYLSLLVFLALNVHRSSSIYMSHPKRSLLSSLISCFGGKSKLEVQSAHLYFPPNSPAFTRHFAPTPSPSPIMQLLFVSRLHFSPSVFPPCPSLSMEPSIFGNRKPYSNTLEPSFPFNL